MQRLAFLAAGSELLTGHVLETNSHWLQNQIVSRGARFLGAVTVPDEETAIAAAARSWVGNCDHLVVSGGLGPTDDDLTREALSAAFGRPLEFDDQAWKSIRAVFERRGREAGPANRKQALRLSGSRRLDNPLGTAPGLHFTERGTEVWLFPGVPSEFKAMIALYMLPLFPKAGQGEALFKLWGLGESALMDLLNREQALPPRDLEWGTIARREGLTLRFATEARRHPEFKMTYRRIRKLLAPYLYTERDATPLELTVERLKRRGITLACAESCTGGMLSTWLTSLPGSSAWMKGAVVAYENDAKRKLLGVSRRILDKDGAVSEASARAMALGALRRFGAGLALAVTGIAGPTGAVAGKSIGTVFIAGALADGTLKAERHAFAGEREDVRERSCHAALLLALRLLDGRS